MFLSLVKKVRQAHQQLIEKMDDQKHEIRCRLEGLDLINDELKVAVTETQVASCAVIRKLREKQSSH